MSKEKAAEELARIHFEVDADTTLIRRLMGNNEDDPRDPIKLLEVNLATPSVGIRPIFFGPDAASGIPYFSVIVMVTPDEYEQIEQQPSLLPNQWKLGPEILRLHPVSDI